VEATTCFLEQGRGLEAPGEREVGVKFFWNSGNIERRKGGGEKTRDRKRGKRNNEGG